MKNENEKKDIKTIIHIEEYFAQDKSILDVLKRLILISCEDAKKQI